MQTKMCLSKHIPTLWGSRLNYQAQHRVKKWPF